MSELFIPPSGVCIVGAVALVVGRFVRNGLKRLEEVDDILHHMYDRKNFGAQRFVRISLMFRYGIKTDLIPEYGRIHIKDRDLPIKIELDTLILDWADKNNPELLKEIFLIATCEAVLHVLRKYKLPTEPVEMIRSKLGDIPLTIEDCEAWQQKTPLTPEAILGFTPPPWP